MQAKPVAVGEIEMAYVEAGGGERPFVLVHGFTGSLDDFVDVAPALAERGRTVLVDQRGHGGASNPGAGYSFEQLVADLCGFLDALGIARCDLLGHSMGGMVAMRLALAHPERLHSLVLMDTSPAPPGGMLSSDMMRAGAMLGHSQGMGALFEVMRKGRATAPVPPSVRRTEQRQGERYWERIRAKIEAMDPEAMGVLGPLLAEHEPVTERLREIRVPTTVIVGEEDVPFRGPSETMAATIPGAELAVIADAAHSPQSENEAAWLSAIGAHLDRARGGA